MNALIYAPSGGGKTVCSTMVKTGKRGKNLLLCSDNSHIVLNNKEFNRPNLDIQVIEHWLNQDKNGNEQKNFHSQFEEAVDSKKYDTIICDNVSDIFDLAILEYDEVGKVKDPRQYYLLVYQSLKRLARKAAQVDCNVIFTAWTDLQDLPLPSGQIAKRLQPKLPNKILDNFLGLTQIVAYINTVEKDGKKVWYYVLSGTQTMYAKDQAFNRKTCYPADLFDPVEVQK